MANGNIAVARDILNDNVQEEAKALDSMQLPALRAKYREVFKEDTGSHNGPWLRKRIAYRLQEIAFGGLSERAKARITELALDTPFRRRGFPVTKAAAPAVVEPAPAESLVEALSKRDRRLPPPGTTLRRQYDGAMHVVVVEADGFVFRGQRHDSLSKIARLITGTNWNGYTFFGLTKPWGPR